MAVASEQRIFPLLLSPIETFMRADDRPEYPMAFILQLGLSGVIERSAFEAALEEALGRHPLLQCVVRPAKRNLPCWMRAPNLMPMVDWANESVPVTCPRGEQIDIEREVGLRIWIRQSDERVRVIMQFHHACCDGVGALRFIGDLLALYGTRTNSNGFQKPSLHPVDMAQLRKRARNDLAVAIGANRRALAWSALTQGCQIMVRGCTPLLPPKSRKVAAGGKPLFPGICSHRFEHLENQQIRDAANRHAATLNDLLLQELLCTIYQWNSRQRPWRPGRHPRIMMPVDLRTAGDEKTPAANLVGYTFIGRRASELRDPEKLLQGIREETTCIKNLGLGKRFSDTICSACSVDGLLALLLSIPRSLATAVLSNVGDPSRRFTAHLPRHEGRIVSGNLILDDITGVPPLRPRTRATFLVTNYNDRLTINLRCDPHLFALDDSQELLSLFVRQLQAHRSN